MDIFLWVITGLLAAAMLGAGLMKLMRPRQALVDSGMAWAEDFSDTQVKAIAALELVGAFGLVLPALLSTAELLVPLAAIGVAVIMVGAVLVHLRRREHTMLVAPVAFAGLGILIAVLRWGPYPL